MQRRLAFESDFKSGILHIISKWHDVFTSDVKALILNPLEDPFAKVRGPTLMSIARHFEMARLGSDIPLSFTFYPLDISC